MPRKTTSSSSNIDLCQHSYYATTYSSQQLIPPALISSSIYNPVKSSTRVEAASLGPFAAATTAKANISTVAKSNKTQAPQQPITELANLKKLFVKTFSTVNLFNITSGSPLLSQTRLEPVRHSPITAKFFVELGKQLACLNTSYTTYYLLQHT